MNAREKEAEAARNRTARRLVTEAPARGHVVTHGITNEIVLRKTVCGTSRFLKKETNAMSQVDFANMSPNEAHELVQKLANLLGLYPEEATHDAVAAAVDRLFSVMTGESTQEDKVIDPQVVGNSRLTASELAACKAQGCSPADFLKVKQTLSVEGLQARLRRADAAVASIKR